MPLIAIKLFDAKDKTVLDAAIAAYKAGDGSDLDDYQRGLAMHAVFDESASDSRIFVALAHGGIDIPASGNKTADLQHVYLEEDKVAAAQTALNTALANIVHVTVTDADLNTTAGDILSASNPFEAEDVGRLVNIAGTLREITAYTGVGQVTYSGTALTGTNQTVSMLGAEVLQDLHLNVFHEADQDWRFMIMIACEGELA